jgi:electron transfer flavoprotein alpha subunit
VRCEHDDGWVEATVALPAVLSVAERLCEPAKVDPAERARVDPSRITTLHAADLGPGPWGQAGSPTAVGPVKVLQVARALVVLGGSVDEQVAATMTLLEERGALDVGWRPPAATVPIRRRGDEAIGVIVEPDRPRLTRELLGAAAVLAAEIGGRVVALTNEDDASATTLSRYGADAAIVLDGTVEEDIAATVGAWARRESPWAILAPSTAWGREVASRVAARLGAGLTGDAVALEVDGGRLVAWKPAFGGTLVAAIRCSSPVQMATVRAGVLPLLDPRPEHDLALGDECTTPRNRVVVHGRTRNDELDALARAQAIVGVGTGVPPDDYAQLQPFLDVLGAELGATRKVTDRGWLPRSRQIGITGHSVAPRLYVALGLSGKFNHMVGTRGAGTVLAVNRDPDALVFGACDIGLVGDWHDIVPRLTDALRARGGER